MTEKYGEGNANEIFAPHGHHKINPIISINDANTNYPILINQQTGEAANNKTYYCEMLDNVRFRINGLKNHYGLEYEVVSSDDLPADQRTDLLMSNIEAVDATLTMVMGDEIATAIHSVACNIEEKIMSFLENLGLEGYTPKSIPVPSCMDITKMFSWGYPNRSMDPCRINSATYYDFTENRRLQIMNNFCAIVYEFIRSVAYDPTMDVGDHFDTRDTLYATLCCGVYNDLSCLDDTLIALITVHCIRFNNHQTPAKEAYDAIVNHNTTQKLPG